MRDDDIGTTPEDAEQYARAVVAACSSMKNTPEALQRFVAALIVDVQQSVRRAAKLEVLREIQRSVQNRNEGAAWSIRIRDKIAALEREGGANDG